MKKASWTPFFIIGSYFLGDVIVKSPEDWQKLLSQYRGIYSGHAEQVALRALRKGVDTRGLTTFTLEHRQGVTLKDWAEAQGMDLVG